MGWRPKASEPAFFRQLPCWRWYGVSMVGVAELGIREYVWRKNQRRRSTSSWNSTYRRPLRGAFIKPPPQGAVADFTVGKPPPLAVRRAEVRPL